MHHILRFCASVAILCSQSAAYYRPGGYMLNIWRALRGAGLFSLLFALLLASQAAIAAAAKDDSMNGRRTAAPVGDAWYVNDLTQAGYWAYLSVTGQLPGLLKRGVIGAGSQSKISPVFDPDNGFVVIGGQAEFSIAVDPTGQNIVVGFNDTRGFSLTPNRLSGVITSSDGGVTWTDRGQLPSLTATTGAVFGDPDVKYVPGGAGCQFIYSSIYVNPSNRQTMSIHRSIDCGVTWQGPFEVLPATTPTATTDSADKEFIDVDPDTGRVMMGWSNFSTGGVGMSVTYSDDIMTGYGTNTAPTWSPRTQLEFSTLAGQSMIPRFAGNGSSNAIVAYVQRSSATTFSPSGYGYHSIRVSRSSDNGATWTAPVNVSGEFYPADYNPGNDRIHSFPGLAIDTTSGPRSGTAYLAYVRNDNKDGGDVAFQKSTDGGATWSTPIYLNARPGNDRQQWFPHVAVDGNGRVSVMYYDQGIGTSGDLTEMTWLYSDDGGTTWVAPSPMTDRPFRAGFGNDTGQPNLGDYNGIATQGGSVFAAFAGTAQTVGFAEGQPSTNMNSPDFVFAKVNNARAAVRQGAPTVVDSNGNGNIDPGEIATLTIPLENYVAATSVGSITYTGINATLTSPTVGVSVTVGSSAYGNLAPLAVASNSTPFKIKVAPGFVAGTPIELKLSVTTAQGRSTDLLFTLPTGTPVNTALLSDNFDALPLGDLTAATTSQVAWSSLHGGGTNTTKWGASDSFCGMTAGGGNKALFMANNTNGMRFDRALSPYVSVGSTTYGKVTLDFDICYNLEEEKDFNVLAYDGLTLRLTDQTGGTRIVRSVLAEAFAESITTTPGNTQHFPRHLPRNSSTAYFQDMSVWSGDSGGWKHVRMVFPVTGGLESGAKFQLRFEYTQDSSGTCADVRPGASCGVAIDNLVVNGVTFADTSVDLQLAVSDTPDPVLAGNNVTYNATVTNTGGAGSFVASDATLTYPLPSGTTFVSATAPAGWSCTTPAVGSNGTISCVHPAMPAGTAAISIVAKVSASTSNGAVLSSTPTVSTGTTDTTPANNSVTVNTTVNTQADIAATQTGPASVVRGNNVSYVVTVTNAGPSDAAGVTLVPATNSGLTATVSGACLALPCTIGTIAAGGSASVTFTYAVAGAYAGPNPITHSAAAATTTNENGATANNTTSTISTNVLQASSSTVLTSGANPSTYPASVTLTATVSGLSPTGTVTFSEGATTLCNAVALSGGIATCTVSSFAVGGHAVTATYGGDIANTSSAGTLNQTVNPAASQTVLTSSVNPSVFGQSVVLTATVTAVGPTGTVAFNDGASAIAGCTSVALTGAGNVRTATCTVSSLPTGARALSAAYSGDTNNNASSGNLTQTVNPAATALSIVSVSPNPAGVGSPVTITISLVTVAPGAGTPTGTVTVNFGSASCTIVLPATSCVVTPATAGSFVATATYAGGGNFTASSASAAAAAEVRAVSVPSLSPALLAVLTLVLVLAPAVLRRRR